MHEKVSITLFPLGKNVIADRGAGLIDVLHEYGVEFPCGAKGTCGRCRVKVLDGELEIDTVQRVKLKELGLDDNWRLACFCHVNSDVVLEVLQFENIILADNTRFRFTPGEGYGIAVDLGTTTIVAQLIDLKTSSVLDAVPALNPQVKFGSDLISRIQNCLDGNQMKMQKLIHHKIGEMIRTILDKYPVDVSKVVIVGNTVMHHIFSGLDVQPLSFYPFESPNLFMQHFSYKKLQWEMLPNARIRFFPSIGSFIGSDILAGIAATNIAERENYSILVDLGTNGEIVLGNHEKIICASTAAGPAFEGAKISQGMRAVTGAISSIHVENDELKCDVIGNVPARGICGSGLIDAIAGLVQQGIIGMFGEMNSDEEKVELTPGVFLTQQDIREFQLAKAAIAAGLQILLKIAGITFNEVENVYFAGGFGNFLNVQNVIQTGIIETLEEKIVKMGNTSLIGAKMFLFKDERFIKNILNKTCHINLEGYPDFQDIYVDKMLFFR